MELIETLLSFILPYAFLLMIAILFAVLLTRYFVAPLVSSSDRTPALARRLLTQWRPRHAVIGMRAPLLSLFGAFLLSRAIVYLIGLIGAYSKGGLDGFFANPLNAWIQWDANHYLGIAKNWYVTQGDARFHIVFYPLYPLLVRLFSFGTGAYATTAILLSNLFLLLSGYLIFILAKAEYGARVARRALWLFFFSPCTVFFSVPYTESLFVMLTLANVLTARKGWFTVSICFGALCAFTRLPGALCAVPLFYEMLLRAKARCLNGESGMWKHFIRYMARYAAAACLILTGFAAYVLINKLVTGDAFQFLEYQREHWGQRFGSVMHTVRYTVRYLFHTQVDWYWQGVWFPQFVFLLLAAGLMLFSMVRTHPADAAYMLLYFIVTVSPTWLISGPRYLCAMYAAYPALALLMNRRIARWIAYPLYALLFLYCTYMFAVRGYLL